MKTKIFPLLIIFIFLIIFFIFYKGLQNSNIYTPNEKINKNIPFFKAEIFDSRKTVNSGEIFLDDKYYLMNIWSSWCVPCRDEHQFLLDLNEYKDLEIIGLNYKDDIENAKKFLNELKSPYNIILSDEDGTIAIEWGAFGVPETFLIYDKIILKKIIGPLNENLLLEIKNLIK
tara:strand:- start:1044 stop:1562 length:519 start_codon:yes stop_codon:yes gene_type:complete